MTRYDDARFGCLAVLGMAVAAYALVFAGWAAHDVWGEDAQADNRAALTPEKPAVHSDSARSEQHMRNVQAELEDLLASRDSALTACRQERARMAAGP